MALVRDTKPPGNYPELHDAMVAQYGTLSKQLQQVARFALDHPTQLAMATISSIAKDANVQPSTIIRFANAFGFSGFSEMQRIFQDYVSRRSANYKERVRLVMKSGASPEQWSNEELLQKFCATSILSLENLAKNVDAQSLDGAIELLQSADRIYVMGQRRSYPVSTYLVYILNHSQCRAHLLDGQGGLLSEQLNTITERDVLIATTFQPYAEETRSAILAAKDTGANVILITDSSLYPLADKADVCFLAHDAEVLSFRSLTSSMCLAQSLATALVFRNKPQS